jgi:hypothetical protein
MVCSSVKAGKQINQDLITRENITSSREAKYDKTASASQDIVYGFQLNTQLMEAKT